MREFRRIQLISGRERRMLRFVFVITNDILLLLGIYSRIFLLFFLVFRLERVLFCVEVKAVSQTSPSLRDGLQSFPCILF